jgi:magnesium chelatase subunit I
MMTIPDQTPHEPESKERIAHSFRSLSELVDYISGKSLAPVDGEDAGLGEAVPYPFLALVGQREMKLALLLGLINPSIGGILLIGPRGTAKTTAVRSLLDLLPNVDRSLCHYGCLPEDILAGGLDAVCPDCAKKFAENQPLTKPDRVRLIELPLNARLEDVIGGINERAAIHERLRIHRGILAQADRNLLFIDEINLLDNEIVDAILDASAQGSYTVRRGPVSATYRSRFVLIGSMNPEEGNLRPQIFDRFGLRLIVRGLENVDDRLEAYRRVRAYLTNPRQLGSQYADTTNSISQEIQAARQNLNQVKLPDSIAQLAIKVIQQMGIDSLRAEITWFEAARAHAAADDRTEVNFDDLRIVASMALRMRRSKFMQDYFTRQKDEEEEMQTLLSNIEK